ncbi:aerobic-type carbon monoxide dehydrogenase, CoxI accessory protein [Burkholderiales bacterium]|jgi:xanthine dehydrogenase accessory factor|nr:aerobic-type carbon monoxide dehydrogenase, CoxI accessory protein [Burkholderiales bacterium]
MDSVDTQVLKKADEWIRTGQRAVLGTVIRTWGSAPRPVGALVAIRADGQIVGSVSGGCIEDDLIDKIRSGSLLLERPRRMKYGISAEEATRFGLPCGGTLELVLEPLTAQSKIDTLLERVGAGRQTARKLDLRSGEVSLSEGKGVAALSVDESALISVHGPIWRLLIIGAGQLTQYLAEMALALDYQVMICDPREEYADIWSVPGTTLVRTMPDDTVLECKPDPHTAVVALTHDPKLDDLALMEALRSAAFYVGAIGSRKNQEKRKERLKEFGVTDEQLGRLYGPIGLKNGARTPPEIAVSILAELTGVKYGYRIPTPIAATVDGKIESGCAS